MGQIRLVGKIPLETTNDFNKRPDRPATRKLLTYAFYEDHSALVCGLETSNFISLRFREARPLGPGTFLGGEKIENPLTLNGGAGSAPTSVDPGLTRSAASALMLTGTVSGTRCTAV